MSEPHQRTQSGKLRKSSKQNKDLSEIKQKDKQERKSGIENATVFYYDNITEERDNYNNEIENYFQSPCILTDIHVSILGKIATGFNLDPEKVIDKTWRKTWNIGTWMLKNKLFFSFNLVQPNISGCWADIDSNLVSLNTINNYADMYKRLNLPNSSCKATGVNTIKIQGRWTIHSVQKLIDDNIIELKDVRYSSINIGNTKLFILVKLQTGSEYLCNLTSESLDTLIKYLPNSCRHIQEVSSGGGTSIRVKNPETANDSLQLTIDTFGSVRYNGKLENLYTVTQGLYASITELVASKRLKLFLNSLEYKKI